MEVHHIGYLVKNIDDSRIKFLELGYEAETSKEYDDIRGIYIQFLVNGNYRVELIEPASEKSQFHSALKRFRNLPYHICYVTEDIDGSIDEYAMKGFMLSQAPELAPCIGNRRVAFMQSPTMGIIELLEKEIV